MNLRKLMRKLLPNLTEDLPAFDKIEDYSKEELTPEKELRLMSNARFLEEDIPNNTYQPYLVEDIEPGTIYFKVQLGNYSKNTLFEERLNATNFAITNHLGKMGHALASAAKEAKVYGHSKDFGHYVKFNEEGNLRVVVYFTYLRYSRDIYGTEHYEDVFLNRLVTLDINEEEHDKIVNRHIADLLKVYKFNSEVIDAGAGPVISKIDHKV